MGPRANDRIILYARLLILLCVVHGDPNNEWSQAESKKDEWNLMKRQIRELRKLLEVNENDTEEEEWKKLYVDFSILPKRFRIIDRKLAGKVALNIARRQIFGENDIRELAETLHPSDRAKYDLKQFSDGVVALGVGKFLAAATQFCDEEAAGGRVDIVSVGSGNGTIEKAIMAEYRSRYGKDLPRIKLVDPDPAFNGIVDFKTVDQLIQESPNTVGNCVALIIWPPRFRPDYDVLVGKRSKPDAEFDDIEVVRKLQPRAVLIVYDCMGASGSIDFRAFLRDDQLEALSPDEIGVWNWEMANYDHNNEKRKTPGLDHYSILEIAHQKMWVSKSGTHIVRMVKLKRDGPKHDSSDL